MNKLIRFVVLFIALALVGYYFASPYHTLYNLKTAVEQKDAAAIVDTVDFVSVKSSIKDQVKTKLNTELPDSNDNFAMLGAAFATVMVDSLIDHLVSPKSVELMVNGQDIGKQLSLENIQNTITGKADHTGDNSAINADGDSLAKTDELQFHPSYQSLNTFTVDIKKANADKALTVVMERQGLFTWKIVDVRLPME